MKRTNIHMQTIQNYCVTTEGSYLDVLSLISSSSSSTGISSLFFCGADCLLSSCEHKMMFYINETPSTSLTQEFPTVLFHMHPYQTACFKTLFKQLLTIRLCLLHKHPYPTLCAILSQNDLKINLFGKKNFRGHFSTFFENFKRSIKIT